MSPFLKQIRYSAARALRKIASRLAYQRTASSILYSNMGSDKLPASSRKALIIYTPAGIERYLRGIPLSNPFFNKHTIYWESVEMVRQLNKAGYLVDYADNRFPVAADWSRYDLVIDIADNLKNIPANSKTKKVLWATYNHWLHWNMGELQRIESFKNRTGIVVPMNRQLPNNQSDEHADYITYFGTDLQIDSFSKKPEKVLINISSCYVPPYKKKNIEEARNKFLWIAGGGVLHKGLHLAIEAFQKVPEAELFVVGDMKDETQFYKWASSILVKHRNIHESGWFDLTSPEFDKLADQCIGVLYLASACGGPGATARVLHNGLIPIVTPTGFVRAEHLGYQTTGQTDQEIIDSVVSHVRTIMQLPKQELQAKSNAVREFAKKNHTREAFSQSFSEFISRI